jgi:hypothetical protein
MVKEIMAYIYTMEYHAAIEKSEITSFLGKLIELEIMLSKVSQKDKYSMSSHIQILDLQTNKHKHKKFCGETVGVGEGNERG